MHILYIHQYFATPHGKTGTRSYEFAKRWVAAGHRVTMLTSVGQLTEEDLGGPPTRFLTRLNVDGIEVVALNVRYDQTMGFLRRVRAFLRFMIHASWEVMRIDGVDVVYATSTPLTGGVPALVGWWLGRKPYAFEVRDVWPAVPIAMGVIRNRLLIRFLRLFERTIYRQARAIVALSPGMEASIRRDTPPWKRIATVPNSSDTDLFRPGIDGEVVRRERGWHGRFVCIHTGAMGPANGLDVIVHAAQHFRSDPGFLFVLLGEGSEKARLRALCERLDLDNLEIIDSVPKHTLPAVVAASDVCLVTVANVEILQDNSANKFFDSLSAGKPVLLNYSGWQREVLESNEAGLGCAMGDETAFFAGLAALKGNEARRMAMGCNARRLAEERYSCDVLAAEALGVIVGVCGR